MASSFSKQTELTQKIIYTLLALIVCRIGSYIPVAGVNSIALEELSNQNQAGILGMFNTLSGGSLGRMSIFALSIMPYITASIIMQLLTVLYKPLEELKKEGESGRKKITQYTRYMTVIFAAVQAFGVAASLEGMTTSVGQVVIIPGLFFKITTVITLVVGTVLLMWIGEQISVNGIGNGVSLIIFVGIVSKLPSTIVSTFELSRSGTLSPMISLLFLAVIFGLIFVVIFVERAQRKVLVQYPKRQSGNKMFAGDKTHIPLKLNTAGVIPPIFASSILLFPLTIINFTTNPHPWLENVILYLNHGKPLYMLCYVGLIIFFAFFYTSFIFNSEDTAKNLKKSGAYIPGRRPGEHTSNYLDYVLNRITLIGGIYLALICALPEMLSSKYSIPFTLGGTGILIMVNVIMDTFTQIQTHLFSAQYDQLLKKAKLKDKKK